MTKFTQVFFLFLLLCCLPRELSQAQSTVDQKTAVSLEKLFDKVDAIKTAEKRHLQIINERKAFYSVEVVYTILNGRATNLGDLQVWHDGSLRKLEEVNACIHNENGKKVKCFRDSDWEEYPAYGGGSFHQDDKIKYIEIRYHEYPYQIRYSYKVELNGLFNLPSWHPQTQENVAVRNAEFVIEAPKGFDFRYKWYNINTGFEPEIWEEGNQVNYKWTIENWASLKIEPMGPPIVQQLPTLKLAPNKFSIEGYEGDASTWESFGDFNYALQIDRDILPEKTIKEVQELIAGMDNSYEKVQKIYQYVQDNTRYVSIQLGIGGWQPFSAEYVDKNKYGDCKALSNYTGSLLKAVEIPAYYTLINAGKNAKSVDPEFSANQFNHAILTVPLEKDTLFLECTNQVNPINYLGAFTDDRYACMIMPEGSQLIRTPAYTKENNYIKQETQIQIEESGNAKVEIQLRGEGEKQDYYRQLANYTSKEEQKKVLLESFDIPSFELQDYAFTINDEKPPYAVELIAQVNVRSFASKAGKRYIFTPSLEKNKLKVPTALEDRKQPIINRRAYAIKENVAILIPEGFEIENYQTEPQIVESDFGKVNSKIEKINETEMKYTIDFEMEKFELPPERYEDYRAFVQEVNRVIATQVVIKNVE